MCGIVGYIGRRRAAPVLLDGLKKLEYRGYDSAGIAVLDRGKLAIEKRSGRVAALAKAEELSGTIGIGHTRWATHGAPSERNAHPHRYGKIAVVHNGIIENAAELRAICEARGEVFSSETDSEIAAHVIAHYFEEEGDLLRAVYRAAGELNGSFALAVLAEGKGEIVCARRASPLIVAEGEGEGFVASDIPALAAKGRRAYVLEDGEFARITREKVQIFGADLALRLREAFLLEEEELAPEKGRFAHFMRKEIEEVPEAIQNSLFLSDTLQNKEICEVLCQTYYFDIVACGTAYHSGLCFAHAAERLLRVPTRVHIASEYRYSDPIVPRGTLTVAVSQSGETADTLAAARLAQERGSKVLAITNVVQSSLSRLVDFTIFTGAGREVAVAATKSFHAQLAALYSLLAVLAKYRRSCLPPLEKFPDLAREVIQKSECAAGWSPYFLGSKSVFFLGRGVDRCAAMEGSLKLKEITYLPSEGYAAGELKHGTLALVDGRTPVVAIITDPQLADKTMNAVHEVYARGANVFLITCFPALCTQKEVTASVLIPACPSAFSPMLSVIPLQMLAYHVSLAVGNDPDKPRNLAKSVTVE